MSGNERVFSLDAKMRLLRHVARRASIPDRLASECVARMARGHQQHGDAGAAMFDWRAEIRQELADIVCYAALGLLRGEAGSVDMGKLGRGVRAILEAVK